MQNNSSSATDKILNKVLKAANDIKGKNDRQNQFIQAIQKCNWIIGTGPTGVGRTFLSIVTAMKLIARKQYRRMVFIRPAVNCDNQKIGHLPGNVDEKIQPYIRPCLDVLGAALKISNKQLDRLMYDGVIQTMPLAYLRGLTYNHSIVILDEAQNATERQLDAVIGRIGKRSKLIINGDPNQCDIKFIGNDCPLMKKMWQFEGLEHSKVITVQFDEQHIVRNKMIGLLLKQDGPYQGRENYAEKVVRALNDLCFTGRKVQDLIDFITEGRKQRQQEQHDLQANNY